MTDRQFAIAFGAFVALWLAVAFALTWWFASKHVLDCRFMLPRVAW